MENSIFQIVLGSLLALITSFFVENYKNFTNNKKNTKDFKIVLKLEIKGVLDTIGQLIDDYGQKQFFFFTILNELSAKIQRLDKIRDKVIFINEDSKKEEILFLLNSITLYHSDINTLENRAFTPPNQNQSTGVEVLPWNHEVYKSQRQVLVIKGAEIKRNIQDLIIYLDKN